VHRVCDRARLHMCLCHRTRLQANYADYFTMAFSSDDLVLAVAGKVCALHACVSSPALCVSLYRYHA
jgi:hypothetical protein